MSPFTARSLPVDNNRHRLAHPLRSRGRAVISTPSANTNRLAGSRRGMWSIGARGAGGIWSGRGGPIGSFAAALASSISSAILRNSDQARTTPATEFSSAIAIASTPSSAARRAYSSGWEPPVRKVKFDVMESSANHMTKSIFTFCSHGESEEREQPHR